VLNGTHRMYVGRYLAYTDSDRKSIRRTGC
jgi:hypothetical protein